MIRTFLLAIGNLAFTILFLVLQYMGKIHFSPEVLIIGTFITLCFTVELTIIAIKERQQIRLRNEIATMHKRATEREIAARMILALVDSKDKGRTMLMFLLDYEVRGARISSSRNWVQKILGKYFARRVKRKYNKYIHSVYVLQDLIDSGLMEDKPRIYETTKL